MDAAEFDYFTAVEEAGAGVEIGCDEEGEEFVEVVLDVEGEGALGFGGKGGVGDGDGVGLAV